MFFPGVYLSKFNFPSEIPLSGKKTPAGKKYCPVQLAVENIQTGPSRFADIFEGIMTAI